MNLDWTTIITSVITFIAGGGLAAVVTLKQTRQGMEVDNVAKLSEEYRKLLDDYKATAEESKLKVEELTKEVNDLNRKLSIAETKIENLQLMYENANYMRCTNLNCKKRTPPMSDDVLKMLVATSADKKDAPHKEEE